MTKDMKKNKINILTIMTIIAIVITGCKNKQKDEILEARTNSNAYALIVGMEQSKFAGACPGSELDANNFEKLAKSKNIPSTKFISKQATYKNVYDTLKKICDNYELAIFYYSGHGAQTDKEINPYQEYRESDGKDEYLCLYDKAVLDDRIWEIVSKAKGRVVLLFDCCHSSTMYRAPTFKDKVKFGAPIYTNFTDTVNSIWVLSGSLDSEYSWGSTNGGMLTNAILKHQKNKTYSELFELLENDKGLRKWQTPTCTVINNFDDTVLFLK